MIIDLIQKKGFMVRRDKACVLCSNACMYKNAVCVCVSTGGAMWGLNWCSGCVSSVDYIRCTMLHGVFFVVGGGGGV